MILIRFALHLAVQGHLLENGRFPPPGFNFYRDILHLDNSYNIVIPILNSVNRKKAGMASRNCVVLISKIEKFN